MPVNPFVKGGSDVPIVSGGTGASTASGARTNLMALDETAHDLLDHAGLTGVGDMTIAAHALLDHSAIPHSFLNIGSATAATGTGDLAAGNGTNDLIWDASAGQLTVGSGGNATVVLTHEVAAPGGGGFRTQDLSGNFLVSSSFHGSGEGNVVVYDGTGNVTANHGIIFSGRGWLKVGKDDPPLGDTNLLGNGDFVAHDGTRQMFWDASGGTLNLSGLGVTNAGVIVTGAVNGNIRSTVTNTTNGTASLAIFQAINATDSFTMGVSSAAGTSTTFKPNSSFFTSSAGLLGGVYIRATGVDAPIDFANGNDTIANALRWRIEGGTSGNHFVAGTDNAYDIGAAGATRPRTGYFGTALNVGNGITPSTANGDFVFGDGTRSVVWDSSTSFLTVTGNQNSSSRFTVIASNAQASAQAQIIAENAQGKQLQLITKNINGGEKALVSAAGSNLNLEVGTGTGAGILKLLTGAVVRWSVGATSGHFTAEADNTYDIGASGATRPRTGYFGTALNVGNGITPSSANGDLVAGDGTRDIFYDASDGTLAIRADSGVAHDTRSLHVMSNGAVGSNIIEQQLASNTAGTASVYLGSRSRGTLALRTQVTDNDLLLAVDAAGYLTGGTVRTMAGVEFYADGTIAATTVEQGRISFKTRTGVTTAERWTIRHDGMFEAGVDNAYDLGRVDDVRPRTGYFGTSLVAPVLTSAAALSITSTSTNALTLDSGTTGAVDIGTNANAKTITLGNVTGATALVYNAGTAGHAFTGIMGFFGTTPAAQPAAYTPTNVVTTRTYDANATTLNALADVVGTIIADLQSVGLVA